MPNSSATLVGPPSSAMALFNVCMPTFKHDVYIGVNELCNTPINVLCRLGLMKERTIDRALRWAREKGWSKAEFARQLGVTQANITNWNRRGMPTDKEELVADTLGCTLDELSGRKGRLVVVEETRLIPQFETGGSMGSGVILRDQPGIIHNWSVSHEWISKNVKSYSTLNNLCIVTGFGNSMRPMYNPGDPLLVDLGVKTVDIDGVYFFRVGTEGFIKQLQRIPGIGLRAQSANREGYETWTINESMDFEVFGRVLRVWKSEEV